MSTIGIGLMGFGRIGRNLFRILYQSEDIRLRAISDIADHKALEYLLRFDNDINAQIAPGHITRFLFRQHRNLAPGYVKIAFFDADFIRKRA